MQSRSFKTTVGGKELVAEFSDLAEQASGSVILRYGDTAVLATAVMSEHTRDELDYFPLTVDYEERFYAAGAILGSRFMRREGRPSEDAILSGRVVDRTIRPLFPHHLRNDVQVIITILALDEEDPAVVAVNAASLALGVSDIPWNGPVAAVRIAHSKNAGHGAAEAKSFSSAAGLQGNAAENDFASAAGGLIINPTFKQRQSDDTLLDLLACGKDGTINMIEVGAKEAGEQEIAAGFTRAVELHEELLTWQKGIIKEIGKVKRDAPKPELPTALTDLFAMEFAPRLTASVFSGEAGKKPIHALKKEFLDRVATIEILAPFKKLAEHFYEDQVDAEIHRGALEDNKRPDNRRFDELRPLFAQAGRVSSILHGSGIFYRGGTHVFTALTLGGPGDSQLIDTMEAQEASKRFMHHYNFPPYSGGETGRMGGMNRRAIGHGALAEKALHAVIPSKDVFPYTIRLVSECLASNGSTSMGSVCASTLALMDGGVPITAPVAGIAMGLMSSPARSRAEGEGKEGYGPYKILTDIQGPEDSHGDMDFKVAGTRAGVTAIQMDIKLGGIPVPVLVEALAAARQARLQILDLIQKELPAPRPSISLRAPEILMMKVRPDQIGLVIGGGGKTVNGIKDVCGVEDITIEEDGSIFITGKGGTAGKAKTMIEALVKEYVAGEVYEGEVTRLMDFGAFVRIGPGKDAEGLVHVSEVAPFRINKISDALHIGDAVRVMIKEIDEKGRLNLSIKAADPDFATRHGIKPTTTGEHTGNKHTAERRF